MAFRRHVFALGEWYHCYNRGVDKRVVFENIRDRERFLETLYLCNTADVVRRDNLRSKSHNEIFEIPHESELVNIGAYCLMPNHFHLLLQERTKNGISQFMQKIGTAYTMYFNIKRERVGGLFVKPFRSKYVGEDLYFKYVAQYIHLNPVELFEPGWKFGKIKNSNTIEARLKKYPFNSLIDYEHMIRPEKAILNATAFELIREGLPPIKKMLGEAAEYYAGLEK